MGYNRKYTKKKMWKAFFFDVLTPKDGNDTGLNVGKLFGG